MDPRASGRPLSIPREDAIMPNIQATQMALDRSSPRISCMVEEPWEEV